jgi:hypothetical protein
MGHPGTATLTSKFDGLLRIAGATWESATVESGRFACPCDLNCARAMHSNHHHVNEALTVRRISWERRKQ